MKLNASQRKALPKTSFALPAERKYPISDASHARNALSRAEQNATPTQQEKIKRAVHKKFPTIK